MSSRMINQGQRVAQFRKVFLKALDTAQQNVSLDDLMTVFSADIIGNHGSIIRDATNQFLQWVWRNTKAEFEVILDEDAVIKYLNEIDRLCDDDEQQRQLHTEDGSSIFSALSSQQPSDIVRSQTVALKQQRFKQLHDAVSEQRLEYEKLKGQLIERRARAHEIATAAENARIAFEKAHQTLAVHTTTRD